jgi:hypothetical protein
MNNTDLIPTPRKGVTSSDCSVESADDSRDYKETWEKRWKTICTNPDGSLNLDQIQRELSDFAFMLDQVSEVYCAVTGGFLSKPNYYAGSVISAFEDEVQKRIEQHEKEQMDSVTQPNAQLRDAAQAQPQTLSTNE